VFLKLPCGSENSEAIVKVALFSLSQNLILNKGFSHIIAHFLSQQAKARSSEIFSSTFGIAFSEIMASSPGGDWSNKSFVEAQLECVQRSSSAPTTAENNTDFSIAASTLMRK
jgi:hypothetical protein